MCAVVSLLHFVPPLCLPFSAPVAPSIPGSRSRFLPSGFGEFLLWVWGVGVHNNATKPPRRSNICPLLIYLSSFSDAICCLMSCFYNREGKKLVIFSKSMSIITSIAFVPHVFRKCICCVSRNCNQKTMHHSPLQTKACCCLLYNVVCDAI